MNVVDSLFTTKFREDGSHAPMTLPEYASRFLADIEHWFGPRDRSFALAGIDINKTLDHLPHLWFPDSGIPPDDAHRRSRHVVIRLGPEALNDPASARLRIGLIPAGILESYCPGMSEETSRKLCQPFSHQTESAKLDTAIEANSAQLGLGAYAPASSERDHAAGTG